MILGIGLGIFAVASVVIFSSFAYGFPGEWNRAKQTCKKDVFDKKLYVILRAKREESVSTMFNKFCKQTDAETSSA